MTAVQTCVCQSNCVVVCQAYCQSSPIDSACSQCVSSDSVQTCLAAKCGAACEAYQACVGGC